MATDNHSTHQPTQLTHQRSHRISFADFSDWVDSDFPLSAGAIQCSRTIVEFVTYYLSMGLLVAQLSGVEIFVGCVNRTIFCSGWCVSRTLQENALPRSDASGEPRHNRKNPQTLTIHRRIRILTRVCMYEDFVDRRWK